MVSRQSIGLFAVRCNVRWVVRDFVLNVGLLSVCRMLVLGLRITIGFTKFRRIEHLWEQVPQGLRSRCGNAGERLKLSVNFVNPGVRRRCYAQNLLPITLKVNPIVRVQLIWQKNTGSSDSCEGIFPCAWHCALTSGLCAAGD